MIRPITVLAAVLLPLTACSGGGGGGNAAPSQPAPSGLTGTAAPTASPSGSSATGSATTVRAYLIHNGKVAPVARPAAGPAVATAAMKGLLSGVTAAEKAAGFTSDVPASTALLGVSVTGGVATVDLSAAFASGGGSQSMQARIAQVVYTLTQFPTIKTVRFSLDGAVVTAIGGEGVSVNPPQGRGDWESFTPAILVESPLPNTEVGSPITVTGTANTFEASYQYRLLGPTGKVVTKGSGMATSGSGTRGTFSQTIAYAAGTAGQATIEFYSLSAKDGSEENLYRVPVVLT